MSPSHRNSVVSIGLKTHEYGLGVIDITFHERVEKNTLQDVINIVKDFHGILYDYFLNNEGQIEFPILSYLVSDVSVMLSGKASVTVHSNMRGMTDEQIKNIIMDFFRNGWKMFESEIVFLVFKSEELEDILNMKEEGSYEKLRNLINI
jgi:hypothetical protein